MYFEQRAESLSPAEVAALLASNRSLEAQVTQLKHQLDWFKQQLFGSKSERRLIEPSPDQMSLGEGLRPASPDTEPRQQIPAHTRRRRAPKTDDDAASGLKFDDNVPVEVIELEDPAVRDLPTDELEQISEKVTYRLAQQRGGYVVLK